MNETSKLNEYRINNGYNSFFIGNGIDIGSGGDVLSNVVFNNITNVISYDAVFDQNFDAKFCKEFHNDEFDFVYSSHCLEHIDDPYVAFDNWIRICKSGGHIIFSVPHEIFYEKCKWPSIYNGDHKTSWSLEFKSNLVNSINIFEFLDHFKEKVNIILCKTILKNFDFNRFYDDQTRQDAICQIECVVRKI